MVRNSVIEAFGLNDDREVLSSPISRSRIVAVLAKVNELSILILAGLVKLFLRGDYEACVIRVDRSETNQ